MHIYLKDIEAELKKYFSPQEIEHILAYYEKEFERRLLEKEDMMMIYRSFDIEHIKERWLPEVLKMRKHENHHIVFKSLFQLIAFMYQKSIYLPYAISLSLIMLIIGTLMTAVIYVIYLFSTIFYDFIIDVLYYNFEQASLIFITGVGMTIFSLFIMIALLCVRFFLYLIKMTVLLHIRLIQMKGVTT